MQVERDSSSGSRPHRPLPSVGVPLLAGERRAVRTRNLVVAGTVVIALGGGVAIVALWPSHDDAKDTAPDPAPAQRPTATLPPEEPEPATPAEPAPAPAPPKVAEHTAADGTTRVERRFGKARGFRDALERAGVSKQDSAAIVTALDDLVDFRRCRPEHLLAFERNAAGRLEAFEYRVSKTEVFRARRADDGWQGEEVEIPVERKRVARGSHISNSLGGALEAQGLGRSLTGVFVEVFEGQVDFYRDTRQGDSFRIIVDEEYVDGEMLRYGTVHALEYNGERVGTARAFWFEPGEGKGDFYDDKGRAVHGGWLRTPLRYDHISSEFNLRRRHPVLKRIMPHNGVDYAASPGTRVWSAADGVVKFAGYRGANGNLIVIRHDDGYETAYAHLSRIARGIKRGVEVEQRQTIGAVGSTGRSTGPHLHFGLKRHGKFLDPMKELNGPGKPLPSALRARYKRHVRKLEAALADIPLASAPPPRSEAAHTTEVFHD